MSVRLGLALGGGAARGLAHLGVLQVLLDAGFRPDVVAGTSFGALAGAAVASRGLTPAAAAGVIAGVTAYARSDAFRHSKLGMFRRQRDLETGRGLSIRDVVKRGVQSAYELPATTLVPDAEVRAAIDAIVPDVAMDALPCAFGAVAVDVGSGEELLLDAGSLRLAVRASCAIPGLMEPVDVGHRLALDGGWADKVPAGPARLLGAGCVVAVDVSDELADTESLAGGMNAVHRGDAIRSHRLKMLQLREADFVLTCDLRDVGWADFERAGEIVERGRRAAAAALPAIGETLDEAASFRSRAGRLLRAWKGRAVPDATAPVRCAARAGSSTRDGVPMS